jgi:hypothetical protein
MEVSLHIYLAIISVHVLESSSLLSYTTFDLPIHLPYTVAFRSFHSRCLENLHLRRLGVGESE